MEKQNVIAIDGPSGSGKSTVAKILAKELGITYIDTGAMFRTIGLFLEKNNIKNQETETIKKILSQNKFEYLPTPEKLVTVNGEDYSLQIREHIVSSYASRVSQWNVVRDFVEIWEKSIVSERWAILDGRDIGTVIFPQAKLKFFVTATPMVRTNRRLNQLKEKDPKGSYSYTQIYKDIVDRDKQDMERPIAPLKLASDAIYVDTSFMNILNVVQLLKNYYKEISHAKL
jgi:cytidylate kinase